MVEGFHSDSGRRGRVFVGSGGLTVGLAGDTSVPARTAIGYPYPATIGGQT
ncbi:hypothetical protein L665_00873 [Ralstonia solanacearum SD54]|nr:hypothetical protein L665_00873 [Ralstonia solanacearum SD54]